MDLFNGYFSEDSAGLFFMHMSYQSFGIELGSGFFSNGTFKMGHM